MTEGLKGPNFKSGSLTFVICSLSFPLFIFLTREFFSIVSMDEMQEIFTFNCDSLMTRSLSNSIEQRRENLSWKELHFLSHKSSPAIFPLFMGCADFHNFYLIGSRAPDVFLFSKSMKIPLHDRFSFCAFVYRLPCSNMWVSLWILFYVCVTRIVVYKCNRARFCTGAWIKCHCCSSSNANSVTYEGYVCTWTYVWRKVVSKPRRGREQREVPTQSTYGHYYYRSSRDFSHGIHYVLRALLLSAKKNKSLILRTSTNTQIFLLFLLVYLIVFAQKLHFLCSHRPI